MRLALSLIFLAARLGDWLSTLALGGVEIEGNPVALSFGLFPTMAITSLFGLVAVLFAWELKPATGRLGMAALLCIAFVILVHNLTLMVLS